MSATTKIEWTDRTWNPTTGCTEISPGCDHCYALTMHERFHGKGSFAKVELNGYRTGLPFTWRKPAKVFVNSMSDLFHRDIPSAFIAEIWAVMALTPQHTYQVLTKRHARMRSLLSSPAFRSQVADTAHLTAMGESEIPLSTAGLARARATHSAWPAAVPDATVARVLPWPLPNVWLGVSTEDQHWADIRIPALLETPAAVRWISAEPLLGSIDLAEYIRYDSADAGLDWVVAGGESGPGARPMDPAWPRSLRDQCGASPAFHFKQWGAHDEHGHRVGKGKAGRLLDGRAWDEYPEPRPGGEGGVR
jgi:protein gp37